MHVDNMCNRAGRGNGGIRSILGWSLLALILALLSCGDDGGSPPGEIGAGPPEESTDSVAVVFTRDAEPVPVWRMVPADSVGLETSLERLLRGPTAEERAAGIASWFSAETAGALAAVTVDSTGRAVVDFRNLPSLVPGASSSAGSEMLLQQLNGTVFRFPEIESVEYRVEGSCDRFWEWLQYGCRVVERGEVTG